MQLISDQAMSARNFMTMQFASSFTASFRALQDMAVAGSKAYKNNGKRAWFGFGRDLSIESMMAYQDSVSNLVSCLYQEGFIDLPAAKGISREDQVGLLVRLFFTAYPNWPDAVACWEVVGEDVARKAVE